MVQILEQLDVGADIGRGLRQGATSALDLLIQSKLKGMQDKAHLELQSRLKKEEQREKMAQLQSLFGGGADTTSSGMQLEDGEYSPGQLIAAEQIFPGAGKILQAHQEKQAKKTEEVKTKSRLTDAISSMYSVLDKVGPGKLLNKATPEGREARQYFDSLAVELEQMGATMVGKGTLSKPRFEFLLKNLPSSKKTQARNKGALKAWSQILGIDLPEEVSEEKFTFAQPGEELTVEKAQFFLEKAKGDKGKARKLAKKYGYQF